MIWWVLFTALVAGGVGYTVGYEIAASRALDWHLRQQVVHVNEYLAEEAKRRRSEGPFDWRGAGL